MSTEEQFASLEVALANGRRLLAAEPEAAAAQAREILSKNEQNREALRLLGQALRRLGRNDEANQADIDAIKAASNEPALVNAAQAIRAQKYREAEIALRPYFDRHSDDPAALRLYGEIAARLGFRERAMDYLRRAVELAPAYTSAYVKLAYLLYEQGDFHGSLEQLDRLLSVDPKQGHAELSKAHTLFMVGDYKAAARLYDELTTKAPNEASAWIGYAHVLSTIGRFDEAVAAYRQAVALRPENGEAWWSLANLKTARFSEDDIAAIVNALGTRDPTDKSRTQLHFALGKAFEDAGDYERSVHHYAHGNQLRAAEQNYNPAFKSELVRRSSAVYTDEYFRKRRGAGTHAKDPIFVVGLPRAGSTLIEQILASHSIIEGTAELPYIPALRQQFSTRNNAARAQGLPVFSGLELTEFGERYLASAQAHRKTGRPYFIDKLPGNWESLGIILSALPNARIIDARRHPMACGFSNFKQLYARGHEFSYSLDWIGRYYADYVRMMRHFDEILPGRIHRVIHEQLIETPKQEIRRLLDYIGVPFEEACLRFYETERPVRTPSAGQVRQPLNRKGMEQWLNFEPWLDELKEALGPVLTAYPNVPDRSELP